MAPWIGYMTCKMQKKPEPELFRMTKSPVRKQWLPVSMNVVLAVSLLANALQGLWISSSDTVTVISRNEWGDKMEELLQTHRGSAAWLRPLVDTPELVVVEAANLSNVRCLLWNHVQRAIYICAE